jgi:hypothetical protein
LDVPDQPPGLTEHVVAFMELQLNVAEVLYEMEQEAEPLQRMSAVGAGGAPTFTMTGAQATLPPGPVQERLYVWPVVRGPRDSEPEGDFVPDQPPDAVHSVAFVDDQVRFVVPLYGTDVGDAENELQTGGGVLTVTLHAAVCPAEVTVMVFVPAVDHCVVNDDPEPVAGLPPPDQVYVPLPAPAVTVAFWFIRTVCDAGEQVGGGGAPTFTMTEEFVVPPALLQAMA